MQSLLRTVGCLATVLLAATAARGASSCLDYAAPGSPVPSAFDPEGDDPTIDVQFAGDLAFVATYIFGKLIVYDMADPAAPIELGRVDVGDESFAVAVAGDLACVPFLNWGGVAGLAVIDVGTPSAPTVVGTYATRMAVYDVVVAGARAYVPRHEPVWQDGIIIIDLSAPAAPDSVGAIPAGDVVAVTGDTAYTAGGAGLGIWSVADPASPVLLGAETPPRPGDVLAVAGSRAYVAGESASSDRLRIIDVSDPAAPTVLGEVSLPDACRDIEPDGDTVYLSLGWSGVCAVDVSDPTVPVVLDTVGPVGQVTQHVALGAGDLWGADDLLVRLPLHCAEVAATDGPPAVANLDLRTWPNPFNPRSTIDFRLPGAAAVHLAVHDAAGRRVRTLAAGVVLDEGAHVLTWDGRDDNGRDVPSGVYFYRLLAADAAVSRRVTLLR
jgi:hypothetical protein